MWRQVESSSTFLVGVLILATCGGQMVAQEQGPTDPSASFSAGDPVEVQMSKKWLPGVVLYPVRDGLFRVKFEGPRGGILENSFSVEKIRRPADLENFPKTPLRTWKDASGKHSVRARLLRVEGDDVVLQREDGKSITIGRAKLSRTDEKLIQRYLESTSGGAEEGLGRDPAAAELADRGGRGAGPVGESHGGGPTQPNPGEVATPSSGPGADPGQPMPEPTGEPGGADPNGGGGLQAIAAFGSKLFGGRGSPGGPPEGSIPPVSLNAQDAVAIDLVAGEPQAPPPDAANEALQPGNAVLFEATLPGIEPDKGQLFLATAGKRAVVSLPSTEQQTRVHVLDLGTATELGGGNIPPGWKLLDVDSAGQQFLIASTEGPSAGQIAVWGLTGNGLVPQSIFQRESPAEILDGRWLHSEAVIVRDAEGVAAIQVAGDRKGEVLWTASGEISALDVSARGAFVALATPQGVAFVNSQAGIRSGWVTSDAGRMECLALDPNGGRLAVATGGEVRVLDLATQSVESTLTLPAPLQRSELQWFRADGLLAGRELVLSTATSTVSGRLQDGSVSRPPLVTASDGFLWYVTRSRHAPNTGLCLRGEALPDAAASVGAGGASQGAPDATSILLCTQDGVVAGDDSGHAAEGGEHTVSGGAH